MATPNRAIRYVMATLALAGAGIVAAAGPASAATVTKPLRTMIADLPVAAEVRTGYNRDLFPHWIDADGDGCNTRYEVLIAEAVTAPSVGSGCTLSGGRWYSYYDGAPTGPSRRTSTSTTSYRWPRRGTPAHATGRPRSARRSPTTWATRVRSRP